MQRLALALSTQLAVIVVIGGFEVQTRHSSLYRMVLNPLASTVITTPFLFRSQLCTNVSVKDFRLNRVLLCVEIRFPL